MLDERLGTPLYLQLKEDLARRIDGMEWEGAAFPSETKLSAEYGVSRITVRHAVAELEKEGAICRKQGRGTFVKARRVEQRLPSFYSFTEEFKKRGWIPSSKVTEFERIDPEPQIALNLNLLTGDKVYRFTRLRYANNALMAVETTWLPEKYFPGLTREMLESSPLYEIMRNTYGIVPISAKQWLGASIVYKGEGNLFNTAGNIAVIDMERFASDGVEIVEYTHTLARGDKFRFQIDLK